MIKRFMTAVVATLGLSLFAGAPVLAQTADQAADQAAQIEPITNEELTDEQVVAFIDAAEAIQAVIEDYRPQIEAAQAAQDAAQAQSLQQQAQGAFVMAVEETGLTAQDYQRIAAAAQTDQAVAGRLRAEAASRADEAEAAGQ